MIGGLKWRILVIFALVLLIVAGFWVPADLPWTPAWGLFAVSVVAVGIAGDRVIAAYHTARQRETLRFMHDYNNNPMVSEGFAVIQRIKLLCAQQGAKSATVDAAVQNALSRAHNGGKERMHFLFLANKFEILAIGLEDNIYDQEMIDRFLGRDIVEIYNDSLPLIKRIRESEPNVVGSENKPVAFEEFEKLAQKIDKR